MTVLVLCATTGIATTGIALGLAATRAAAPGPTGHQTCVDGCWQAPAGPAGGEPAGPPQRVRIPRIGVDSALTVLAQDGTGRLTAPADYDMPGWYGAGPAPGDAGPAIIAGHVDSKTGPAVFYRLPELRPGDRVEVRRGDGWVTFRVVGTARHDKDKFPTDAVYGPTPIPELRLVTCAGRFNARTGHYPDNLVVFAVAELPVAVLLPTSAAK